MNYIQLSYGDQKTPRDGERAPTASQPTTAWLWQLRRYLLFLGRKWWVVALAIGTCCALGLAYNRWLPQSYVSTARLWMPDYLKVNESVVYDDHSQIQDIGSTQAELLRSDLLDSRALATLAATGVVRPDKQKIKLKVTQVPKTSLLEISARSSSSNYARLYLDAIMTQLLAYEGEIHDQQSQVTFASVNDQIAHKEKELKAQQDKLATYMHSNNVPVLEEVSKSASVYLSELLTDYSRLTLQYKLLKAACEDGSLNIDTASLLPDLKMATPESTAQGDLEKLKLLRTSFSKCYRPAHPKMARLEQQILQAQGLCDSLRLRDRSQMQSQMNLIKVKLDSTQDAIRDWESKVNNASVRIAEYERVKLEEQRTSAFCDHLAVLLQNVDVSRNLPHYSLSVLDHAAPAKPAKLSPVLVLALAAFFGLTGGLVLVRLIEMMSDKVTSLEYLSHHFGERIMGHIPEVPQLETEARLSPLELSNARHLYAESFRSVRSTLFSGIKLPESPRVLLITSAVPKEGKSTVAANLASTIAFGGNRVLLIDADMRRGKLHTLFNLPQQPGLADFLAQDLDLDAVVQETATKNLFVLSRGVVDGHVGENLLRPAFKRLLDYARANFDYTIVDSVPVLATDDTTSVAPKTDGVIFVMRDSFTSANNAEQALRALYDRQVKVLGIVFNRVSKTRDFSYFDYPEYYEPNPVRMKNTDVAVFDS